MPHPGFILDMDGVLYHGPRPLPGAQHFLQRLAVLPHLFLTNNPRRSPRAVARRLTAMGLGPVAPEQILTSAEATAQWLTRRKPGFRYLPVGDSGLHEALRTVGCCDPEQADFVVVGEGPGLDYDILSLGINRVMAGAELVVTNPDTSVDDWRDGRHWLLPGGGALVAPFERATGRRATIIGKPEPLLFRMALERLGLPASRCIMVGDRPDTDIAGAARVGMRTALVRTGRFAPGAPWPESLPPPDWDSHSLEELLACLETAGVLDPL